MYQSDIVASPYHILLCGRLVYRLWKLTLDKLDLKNRKSLMLQCFQAISYSYKSNVYTSNSPTCIVLNLNTMSSIKPFLNLA